MILNLVSSSPTPPPPPPKKKIKWLIGPNRSRFSENNSADLAKESERQLMTEKYAEKN